MRFRKCTQALLKITQQNYTFIVVIVFNDSISQSVIYLCILHLHMLKGIVVYTGINFRK